MDNNQARSNSHFSGTYNPDQNQYGTAHPPGGIPGMPQPTGLPTVIDSQLSLYVMGGLVAYSIYTKYFQKRDYDGDGVEEGCPIKDEPLCFN